MRMGVHREAHNIRTRIKNSVSVWRPAGSPQTLVKQSPSFPWPSCPPHLLYGRGLSSCEFTEHFMHKWPCLKSSSVRVMDAPYFLCVGSLHPWRCKALDMFIYFFFSFPNKINGADVGLLDMGSCKVGLKSRGELCESYPEGTGAGTLIRTGILEGWELA